MSWSPSCSEGFWAGSRCRSRCSRGCRCSASRPVYGLEDLAARGRDHRIVFTGCRKGLVRQALEAGGYAHGPAAAAAELDRLVALFGADRVVVELTDHLQPTDSSRNRILANLAGSRGLAVVATNNVHYAQPKDHRLAAALAAVRARRDLDSMDGWLPRAGTAFLRSGEEMLQRFGRFPGALEYSARPAGHSGSTCAARSRSCRCATFPKARPRCRGCGTSP